LREAALELVLSGETSISEANRITFVEHSSTGAGGTV
jgi:hypothetical protein